MVPDFRLDEQIVLKLRRDEAIVLFNYLVRETWTKEEKNLRASFEHAAEPHSLQALVQELIPKLIDTGSPEAAGIWDSAREHLLRRHT